MLKQDGTVWGAGINTFGQLGVDPRSNFRILSFIIIFSGRANAVAAGSGHSLVLKKDGSVWCAGRNLYGQLGDGSLIDRHSFVQVINGHAKAVAAGMLLGCSGGDETVIGGDMCVLYVCVGRVCVCVGGGADVVR